MLSALRSPVLCSFFIVLLCPLARPDEPEPPPGDSSSAPEAALTLNQAVRLAIERHPRLAAGREAIQAAAARRTQAGLIPNPELGVEAEEIRFGDSPASTAVTRSPGGALLGRSRFKPDDAGFGATEFTLGVSQEIELGGKRAHRVNVAERGEEVARWDYEIARADVILATRRAFLEVLAGQERVALRRRLVELAQNDADAVQARVDAGKVTPLQGNRARVELAQARIQLRAAQRALTAARYQLAALWDDREPRFAAVRGDLYTTPPLPDRTRLERQILDSPDLTRWAAEVARREASAGLERARGIPNLSVSLGWRATTLPSGTAFDYDGTNTLEAVTQERFEKDLANSLVLGFSIPLPIFDRNQGNRREAQHLVNQGTHERRVAFLEIYTLLTGLYEDVAALEAEVSELRDEILPTAAQTFEATQLGYEQGKFAYLDVLDTQRTLFDVRNQYIEALAAYHRQVAEMERFLGESLDLPETTP